MSIFPRIKRIARNRLVVEGSPEEVREGPMRVRVESGSITEVIVLKVGDPFWRGTDQLVYGYLQPGYNPRSSRP